MKLRNALFLAALGMAGSSAGALALPVPHDAWKPAVTTQAPVAVSDMSHFVAGQTLTVDARLGHASLARGGDGETYLFASVSGVDAPSAAPPLHLAVVIDRSGSMKGERIARAIDAASAIVERMREGDSITVVSFDTTSRVVVPPTTVGAGSRASIEAAIRSIRLGGDTCISCGLRTAMTELDTLPLSGDHVTRMILLSDGATNHGITDMGGLRAMAGHMRDQGVSITTMGVDVDFDEKVMAALAIESNGRHYFVENAASLPAIFSQEFDSLLASVASDGEMTVELPEGVEVEQVFDRSFRREVSGGKTRVIVPFGTFSAKQQKTVLMKLRVPVDRDGTQPVAAVSLAYRDLLSRRDGSCAGDLALAVKSDGTAQRELDPFVATRLERSRTGESLTAANDLFEQGKVAQAQEVLATRETELRRRSARIGHHASPMASDRLNADFDKQLAFVDEAEKNFAPAAAAPMGGGGVGGTTTTATPAPVQDTRAGRAQVRANQQNAADMGF